MIGIVNAPGGSRREIEELRSLISELDERVTRLEISGGGVTGNPFTVKFDTLDQVNATGVWDQPKARIEF